MLLTLSTAGKIQQDFWFSPYVWT